jgi:DNA-directed RNA polymerase specialized sigma24 family protein
MVDPNADHRFRGIFDQHHRAILGFFYRRLDPDEAFDATEDVFLAAWQKLRRSHKSPTSGGGSTQSPNASWLIMSAAAAATID